MGLFDEIKRSLEEAINEAQGRPNTPRRRPAAPRPQPNIPQEPTTVPYEDELESVPDRQRQISHASKTCENKPRRKSHAGSGRATTPSPNGKARKRAEAEQSSEQREWRRNASAKHLGPTLGASLTPTAKNPGQLKEALCSPAPREPISKRDQAHDGCGK